MKSLKIFVILLLAMIINLGCRQDYANSIPPHLYSLNLQVFDKNGKNMANNYKLNDKPSGGYLYEIIDPVKVVLSTPGTSFTSGAWLARVIKLEKYQYVYLDASIFAEGKGFSDKLVHKFTDKRLFGDEQEHIFESEWELQQGGNTVCKSVRVDGKAYPVTEDKNDPRTTGNLVIIQLD